MAACRSQVGSGALPVDLLASFAVAIAGRGLEALAAPWRRPPRPVLGRIAQRRLWLDCRCPEADDEAELLRPFAGCPPGDGARYHGGSPSALLRPIWLAMDLRGRVSGQLLRTYPRAVALMQQCDPKPFIPLVFSESWRYCFTPTGAKWIGKVWLGLTAPPA